MQEPEIESTDAASLRTMFIMVPLPVTVVQTEDELSPSDFFGDEAQLYPSYRFNTARTWT